MAGEFQCDYFRKGATLNLADVTIAAVAIHNRLAPLTDNTKDFPMADLSLYPLPQSRSIVSSPPATFPDPPTS